MDLRKYSVSEFSEMLENEMKLNEKSNPPAMLGRIE